MKVKCPTCQKEIEWSDAFPYRPFCSERCKLIDLGAWASGEFAIAGEPAIAPGEQQNTDDPTLH